MLNVMELYIELVDLQWYNILIIHPIITVTYFTLI